jgi:hypothetical protein
VLAIQPFGSSVRRCEAFRPLAESACPHWVTAPLRRSCRRSRSWAVVPPCGPEAGVRCRGRSGSRDWCVERAHKAPAPGASAAAHRQERASVTRRRHGARGRELRRARDLRAESRSPTSHARSSEDRQAESRIAAAQEGENDQMQRGRVGTVGPANARELSTNSRPGKDERTLITISPGQSGPDSRL